VGVRSAIGVGSLPGNIPVEIEAIFRLKAWAWWRHGLFRNPKAKPFTGSDRNALLLRCTRFLPLSFI